MALINNGGRRFMGQQLSQLKKRILDKTLEIQGSLRDLSGLPVRFLGHWGIKNRLHRKTQAISFFFGFRKALSFSP
jgi:hypothetical protein